MFFVLRHGQTDWNAAYRLQGSTDIALNEKGREQARTAAKYLINQGITKIIASPLSRAFETAQIVCNALGLEPNIEPLITERGFGLFEGFTFADVAHHRAKMGDHMNAHPDLDGKHYPYDAEPLSEVIERVARAVDQHRNEGEICLFVSHGIPFRTIARRFLGQMYSSPNAAPVKYVKDSDKWQMIGLDPNNTPVHHHMLDVQSTMGKF